MSGSYDLHTHSILSDGEMLPIELIRRMAVLGYTTLAITDHVDASNTISVIGSLGQVRDSAKIYGIRLLCGVEITHVPPSQIADLAKTAKTAGADIVIVDGETPVEPVAAGTNHAACVCKYVNVLAHPALITLEDALHAAKNGIALEITSRGGHNRTNGHVAQIAREAAEGTGRFRGAGPSALTAHRDGIVGPWNSIGTAWPSTANTVSPVTNLGRWDARIRRFVFESELLSSLAFTVNGSNQSATLWHGTVAVGPPMTTTWTSLVEMVKPGTQVLAQQLNYGIGYADLRVDRAREITAQMSVPYGFWASVVPLYGARHRHVYELLQLVLRLAKYAEMNFKNAFAVLRPHELSPQVQPMIPTPNHGSLPSGHSTEAHAVARVLFELASKGGTGAADVQLRELLMRQAARIAINRTVAGMHYPVDSTAGQALGLAVGEYFIQRCQAQR